MSRGVHVRGDPDLAEQLAAWSLVPPARAAFTHLTAAEMRGWWLPGPVDHPVFAAVKKAEPYPERPGLRTTRLGDWPSAQIVGGVRLTTPAESLLAAARDLGLLDLVQLGDSALRRRDCTVEDLWLAAAARRAGAVRLRQLIPLLDDRSESPWESAMRLLHQAADIPVEPQKKIHDASGRFVARVDLWIIGTRRVHEYDGDVHREKEAHRSDLRRDRRLVDVGADRLGYTSVEVLHEGGSIIAGADRALGRTWDPIRLRRWNALIEDSLWGRTGLARARARWGR